MRTYRAWTQYDINNLLSLHQAGVSLPAVAERMERTYQSVATRSKKLGLHFVQHTRCRLDESAFDTITEPVAWLIGLLFADGFLRSDRPKIRLRLIDADMVLAMKLILKSESPIVISTPNRDGKRRRPQHSLEIESPRLRERLDSLGIPRLKSQRFAFPTIAGDMIRHFIRGYFDGDGGASLRSSSAVQFTGPPRFMETLREHINDCVGIPTRNIFYPTSSPEFARVVVGRQSSVVSLHRYLYANAETFGQRKRAVYDALVNQLVAKPKRRLSRG